MLIDGKNLNPKETVTSYQNKTVTTYDFNNRLVVSVAHYHNLDTKPYRLLVDYHWLGLDDYPLEVMTGNFDSFESAIGILKSLNLRDKLQNHFERYIGRIADEIEGYELMIDGKTYEY